MPGDARRPVREIERLLADVDKPQDLAVRFERAQGRVGTIQRVSRKRKVGSGPARRFCLKSADQIA
jgi:hypothetical protein